LALRPDAGIVVAYGKLIPSVILEQFPKGLINIHASLLPRYRGASPIESAILAGDDATGVTLMRLDKGMDTGPTYDVAKLQLTGTETRPDLYAQLAELGSEHLSAKLTAILEGNIVPVPQDSTQATTVGLIRKQDGHIDWSQPAITIERQIRAYLDWPGSRTEITGTDATITAAHIHVADGPAGTAFKTPSSELAVYAGVGSLIIDRLKPAGKREMTGLEFLAGHPLS
jgi:methionyl-tRNA formyltransferase